MDLLIFAALVVSMDIILLGILTVRASLWVDEWISKKEETYLNGPKEKGSE